MCVHVVYLLLFFMLISVPSFCPFFLSELCHITFLVKFCFYYDFFQDVYFDDESAEVVISSLRLGDDQER